jgi:hypothetical protein
VTKGKNLSNPYSTGGGGVHFEAAVQACFVTLMLTGGFAPCLVPWPVVEIKLQGKVEGFETDDLIVYVEDPVSQERRRLLGQVKHSVGLTAKNAVFGEVLAAAWADFNNSALFTQGRDAIALITGPLSTTDQLNIRFLLDQARATKDSAEFYRNVQSARFSPVKAEEKLSAIELHLQNANEGVKLSRDQVFDFLRHYHVVGYDLDNDAGVLLSLLHSHMSQFDMDLPQWAWARIVHVVQTANRAAGTISAANLPEDLLKAFERRPAAAFPKELQVTEEPAPQNWAQHPDAAYLALAVLIGSWNEKNESDIREVAALLGLDYEAWLAKAGEILHAPDSPLSVRDGRWVVSNRADLFSVLGSRLLDQNLAAFKDATVRVLTERDPAFELPPEERYAASIHGKTMSYSAELRKGMAEGLALLGTHPEAASNCSSGKADLTAFVSVREILNGADSILWGTLNPVLPVLAEASPRAFLEAVEGALGATPCPFDELFAQEDTGVTGRNYLTGLFWALEGLAWDPELLVRVVVALGDLASHDPGGNWTNRPSNSMATILLPWLPQTLASVDKRLTAVRTVLVEQPEVGWTLLLQLLPGRQTISTGTHRPEWRKTIPEHWEKGVTRGEYWDQAKAYAELALEAAGEDPRRLAQLATRLADLPQAAFTAFLQRLASQSVAAMPEVPRSEIWNALTRFARKHRRFPDAKWALPAERIDLVEATADSLAPLSAFERYQYLFDENESDLFEERGNWESQRKALDAKREQAIAELLEAGDISQLLSFAEKVRWPRQVGLALGAVGDDRLDRALLPALLSESTGKRRLLADGYIWRRFEMQGWEWSDQLVSHDWTAMAKARFLSELPFDEVVWGRAAAWLKGEERLYWSEVQANPYQTHADLAIAIAKLLEVGRPHAAIECLAAQHFNRQAPAVGQVVQALLAAVTTPESAGAMDTHNVTELIKFLQTQPGVPEDDLFKVEWAYLQLLEPHGEARPVLLEKKLATDPSFFSDVIKVLYRSKTEDTPDDEYSADKKAIATNAWRLLHEWSTPPGLQADGSFSADDFRGWLAAVRSICGASGHLEVAMIQAGEVLVHVPPDEGGLWINRAVAAELNARDAQELRDGFSTAIFNSRGVHFGDPSGSPERALADEYRGKAEAVEDAGFQRLATTLREIAEGYELDAKRIVDSHKRDDD